MKILSVFGLLSWLLVSNSAVGQAVRLDTVLLQTPTGALEATLNLTNAKQPTTVVLLLAGSGPTDRDGNSQMGVRTNTYKLIAEALAAEGIATLRPDKRGIARNTALLKKEEDLLFDTYIDDAVGWVNWLRQDKRFGKVVVMGHSEGSLVGMIAAHRAKADAYVSLAGGGTNIADVLKQQLKALPDSLRLVAYQGIETLRKGERIANPPKMLMSLFRPSVQPYLISWMKYDPAQEIKRLNVPVLIVQGTTDIQVSVEEGQKLSAAVPKATYAEITEMNHVLKTSPMSRNENIATYNQPTLRLAPALSEVLLSFLKKL